MTHQISKITKSAVTGLIIGTTAGIALACTMKKPEKSSFRRTAANAMDTMGAIMQNLADITR